MKLDRRLPTYEPLLDRQRMTYIEKIMARLGVEPPGPATWKSDVQRRLMHAATDKARPR